MNLTTSIVSTVCGNVAGDALGTVSECFPRQIARSPTESGDVFYVSASQGIVRFDAISGKSSLIRRVDRYENLGADNLMFDVRSIAVVPSGQSGIVIITCAVKMAVFAYNPQTNETIRLAGSSSSLLNKKSKSPPPAPTGSGGDQPLQLQLQLQQELTPALEHSFAGMTSVSVLPDDDRYCWISDYDSNSIYELTLPDRFVFPKPEAYNYKLYPINRTKPNK